MIREERDPAFWRWVAEHAEVAPHTLMGHPVSVLDALVASPQVTPLAAENGGFLFVRLDVGFTHELHTMFRPAGWGREVATALPAATERMFDAGARLLTTQEQDRPRPTNPPKSHGWKAAGDFADVGLLVRLRPWFLTLDAWRASPARRRFACPSQQP